MGRLGLAHQTSAPKVGGGIVLSIGARLLLARSLALALPLMSSAAWMREDSEQRHAPHLCQQHQRGLDRPSSCTIGIVHRH